jgi:hypothetical protein
MTTTLYMLSSPATDSYENLAADAERRARERGCECPRPVFGHFLDLEAAFCTTVVQHTAPGCPLRGAA